MSEIARDLRLPEDSPIINVVITYRGEDVNVGLNWSNTLIRRFRVGDGIYDHLVIEIGEDFVSTKPDGSFIEMLIDLDYPLRFDPCLDEEAIESIALFESACGDENNEL